MTSSSLIRLAKGIKNLTRKPSLGSFLELMIFLKLWKTSSKKKMTPICSTSIWSSISRKNWLPLVLNISWCKIKVKRAKNKKKQKLKRGKKNLSNNRIFKNSRIDSTVLPVAPQWLEKSWCFPQEYCSWHMTTFSPKPLKVYGKPISRYVTNLLPKIWK